MEIPREEFNSEEPPREGSNPEEIHMARDISPSSVMGSAVTEQRQSRSCSRSPPLAWERSASIMYSSYKNSASRCLSVLRVSGHRLSVTKHRSG